MLLFLSMLTLISNILYDFVNLFVLFVLLVSCIFYVVFLLITYVRESF